MVLLSRKLLFEIVDSAKYRDKPLTGDVLCEIVQCIEDQYYISLNPSKTDLKCLKSELYRLKIKAKKLRSNGGQQFRKFIFNISKSKFDWMVSVNRHLCEININKLQQENNTKLVEQKKYFESLLEEKRVEKNKLQESFKTYIQRQNTIENVPNRGDNLSRKRKPFNELSTSGQTKRRKLERVDCQSALDFLKGEGVVPISVVVERNGKTEVIKLLEKDHSDKENGSLSDCDVDELNTLIYILDSFNVSRGAYAELSMLYKTLPRRHLLQQYITSLNSGFKIIDTPDGLGVQQSLCQKLNEVISHLLDIDKNFARDGVVKVKISGDGTNIGKRLHVVNITFTIINERRCGSASGNYPLCIIKTKESYHDLEVGLQDLRKEVETLQGSQLQIQNRFFQISLLLGGDYKFLLVAVGIPCIAAEYTCLYCKCSKKERLNLDLEWSLTDASQGARLEYKCFDGCKTARKKLSKKQFSVVNEPLFASISPQNIVIDTLHMFLRITDKLFNLLVMELRTLDNLSENSSFSSGVLDRNKIKHVAKLETVLCQLGINFHLSVNKETKRLEYRDLIGPEKVVLLGKFRAQDLFDDKNRAYLLQSIWDSFSDFNDLLKSESPDPDKIDEKAKLFCNLYQSAYQARDITPYIHLMRYHVSELVKIHGSIAKFTQQGLEKLNDTITKQYFQGSNHNGQSALRQIMEKQNRITLLEEFERKKSKVLKCSICGQDNHTKVKCLMKI